LPITKELVGRLLWEEEGTALDFKSRQYRFVSATDDDKSELLKDVLAFVNSHRREDAFILLGVREIKGGRSEIVGVDHQLDDAHLQQFVNSKVQRPITFSYTAMDYDGIPIAVLHIPQQKRPLHAVIDFGKVKRNIVYVRRGSATDVASPDEIAAMGADHTAAHTVEPILEFSVFDRATGQALATTLALKSLALDAPQPQMIPDYLGRDDSLGLSQLHVNRDYYRRLVRFTCARTLHQPVSLTVTNVGEVTAHDVRVVLEVSDTDGVLSFLEKADIPDPPSTQVEFVARSFARSSARSFINVERVSDVWRIECRFGKIQPQGSVRLPDDLYAGSIISKDLSVDTQIFADNLSRPLKGQLHCRFEVEQRAVSLDDVKALEAKRYLQTAEGQQLLREHQRSQRNT
jgi:schlafen family protein